MKLVIKAHKLQKVLATAREIVSKNIDNNNALATHMLLRFMPEVNLVVALSGDKEINHYTEINIEPEEGEYIELSSDLHFISLVASRLSDLLTGVSKDSLITIHAPNLSNHEKNLSTAQVSFDNTKASIECSNGRGYTILKDQTDDYQTVTVRLEQRILRELINSTINAVSLKPDSKKFLNNLTINLSEKIIKVLGIDNNRIYLAKYQVPENTYSFTHNVLISDAEDKSLQFGIPRKGAIEVARICEDIPEFIDLEIHIATSGAIRLCEIKKGEVSILFNTIIFAAPKEEIIFPKEHIEFVLADTNELKYHLQRASKFDDIVSLKAEPSTLRILSKGQGSFDSFEASMDAQTIEAFGIRLNCKHLQDILSIFLGFKDPDSLNCDVSIGVYNNARSSIVLIEEATKTNVERRFALSAYGQIQSN